MTTLAKVRAAAAKLGATVEDEKVGHSHSCRVEAPHGKIWAEGDVHELVDDANRPWKPDYADLLSRMAYGLEDCPAGADCEWCNPKDSDHEQD